jgi:putative phosphoesterase
VDNPRAITVGIISDTHNLMRPEALDALQGSDLIIHAGDIGAPAILDMLAAIAPVTAVRGNNDVGPWSAALPDTATLRIEDTTFYVLHSIAELRIDPLEHDYRVVVAGHSHKPSIDERGGVLYVNPGSAGPRRFKLPIAVATVIVSGPQVLDARIRVLA